MTDKQPEALRIAALLEKTGAQGSLRDEAASELRRLHAELETLTLYKSLADEYGLSIFPDIAEMTAELETLRAKLKVYEDLGGAADDVQLLRMGYAAARLEIESLKAQLAAKQPAPRGEPVAWLSPWRADQVTTDYDAYGKHGIPLYTAPQPSPTAQVDVPESEYRRGYRHGYEQRDAEVRGALV